MPTGIKLTEIPAAAPAERIAQPEGGGGGGLSADDAALQARLDNLRRE